MTKPLMIQISGPYMSGTDGDEILIAANLKAMEDYALPIFKKGHLAVIGEWLAWPVIRQAGENHTRQMSSPNIKCQLHFDYWRSATRF